MKQKDIRVGDWVNYRHHDGTIEAVKVENIYGGEFNCQTERNGFDVEEIVRGWYISDTEPIPMTVEMLELNGFKCEKETNLSGCKYVLTNVDDMGTDDEIRYIIDVDEKINAVNVVRTTKAEAGGWRSRSYHKTVLEDSEIMTVSGLQHILMECGIDNVEITPQKAENRVCGEMRADSDFNEFNDDKNNG